MYTDTHDRMLMDEYAAMADRIDSAVQGLHNAYMLTPQEVNEILGCSDNGAMSVGLLKTLSRCKRDDVKKSLARIIRGRKNP